MTLSCAVVVVAPSSSSSSLEQKKKLCTKQMPYHLAKSASILMLITGVEPVIVCSFVFIFEYRFVLSASRV